MHRQLRKALWNRGRSGNTKKEWGYEKTPLGIQEVEMLDMKKAIIIDDAEEGEKSLMEYRNGNKRNKER